MRIGEWVVSVFSPLAGAAASIRWSYPAFACSGLGLLRFYLLDFQPELGKIAQTNKPVHD
jgi:hypothetical protein